MGSKALQLAKTPAIMSPEPLLILELSLVVQYHH